MKREVTLFLTVVVLVTILWVSLRTLSNKTRKVAMTEATTELEEQNPGCETKGLNNYTAIHVGKVYHHPSIVHYAKLGSSVMQLNFREYRIRCNYSATNN